MSDLQPDTSYFNNLYDIFRENYSTAPDAESQNLIVDNFITKLNKFDTPICKYYLGKMHFYLKKNPQLGIEYFKNSQCLTSFVELISIHLFDNNTAEYQSTITKYKDYDKFNILTDFFIFAININLSEYHTKLKNIFSNKYNLVSATDYFLLVYINSLLLTSNIDLIMYYLSFINSGLIDNFFPPLFTNLLKLNTNRHVDNLTSIKLHADRDFIIESHALRFPDDLNDNIDVYIFNQKMNTDTIFKYMECPLCNIDCKCIPFECCHYLCPECYTKVKITSSTCSYCKL